MKAESEAFKKRLIKLTSKTIFELKRLPRSIENDIFLKQIIRSSSSVGANYQESQSGHTRKDFIQKLSISLKEESETIYWLELIQEMNNINLLELISDHTEIRMILTKIINTSKKSINQPKPAI